MAIPQPNDFQRGDDFISFSLGSPLSTAEAGPSRLPLSTSDQAILDTKNGRRKNKGKGKADAADQDAKAAGGKKKKKNDKGKGKENGSEGKKEKRGREDVGPKNLKEERKAAERHAPWTDMVDWESCRDPADMLNAEIDAFYRYVSPTRAEYEVRLYMIEIITRAILRSWPDAEVTPFGSWQTQLYLPHGDIDLVVSTKRLNEANKGRLLAELARAMRMAHITDVVAIISKARVPIIKFVTTEGKLNVDISLNQTNGISAGQIINQYLDVLPGCRQLIVVVKAFLSQRSMNEVYTGGLGSYAVICLVISFLQLHPKLRRADIDPEENLGTLLVEFFELYGRNFSYDDVGISIRRGGGYFSKKSRGWYRPAQPFLLSIEDPQDQDNDISGGSFGIRQVKNTLAGAYEMLQSRLFERAEQISGRRSGRYKDEFDPEKMSILTGVMGITKETQKHRSELQRLHREGRLHRILSIPIDAQPENYVQHYRAPPVVGVKRKAGNIRLDGHGGAVGDGTDGDGVNGPSRKKRKGLGAVMMDDEDEEVGGELVEDDEDDDEEEEEEEEEGDEDEDQSDEDDLDQDQTTSSADLAINNKQSGVASVRSARRRTRSEESGEIIEVSSSDGLETGTSYRIPTDSAAGTGKKQSGYESVSHDSDEFEIQPTASNGIKDDKDEDDEDDSRYALNRKPHKRARRRIRAREQRQNKAAKGNSASSESDSDDSSIIAISRPPSRSEGSGTTIENGNGATKAKGSAERIGINKKKRDFWAAKGAISAKDTEGDDDDGFSNGAEFVSL